MNYQILIDLYEKKKKELGDSAYRYISELLREAKTLHKNYWEAQNPDGDHEQAWKSFKGSSLEKLIEYVVEDQVKSLGLSIISGNRLKAKKLSLELQSVKRNLVIDFGDFGMHLPDVDIFIYNPRNYRDIIVISIKTTLRDRVAQTGYWKLKLSQNDFTKDVLVYFITLDEDRVLSKQESLSKPRAIVETDTDRCYVLSEADIQESNNVKNFEHFINDIESWLSDKQK
jgi:type II restriction enzyme